MREKKNRRRKNSHKTTFVDAYTKYNIYIYKKKIEIHTLVIKVIFLVIFLYI